MAPSRSLSLAQPRQQLRRQLLAFTVGAIASLPVSSALAQGTGDYPNRPVRLITGSPGSTADISARLVGQKLVERWGQQIVVDNRGGAGGIVGAEIAVRSPPDGYTIFNGHIGTHASPQFLFRKLSYDPVRDFVPITQLTNSGISLVVHAAVPASNLKEFLGYAKAKAGTLTYGSAGGGTSSQLSGELFNLITGAKLVHVPYKGTAPMLLDTAAGQVHVSIGFLAEVDRQYIGTGKVIPLGVLSPKRIARFPDLPTMAEMGHTGFDMMSWTGLFVPAGTPRAVVTRLNAEITRVVREPEFASWLADTGSEVVTPTPEQFRDFTRGELERWRKMSDEFGIKAEQ